MGLLLWGVVLWLVGKIVKIPILETVGKILIAVAVVSFGLGLIGIHLPLIG